MSNYNEVREFLGSQLKSFQPGLNVYYYTPRSLVPPSAIVQANPTRTIDYEQAYSSVSAEWFFSVMLVVGLVNEEAAQRRVGDLISPGSDLLTALNVTAKNGYCRVKTASIQEAMFGEPPRQGLYTYARLTVVVRI